MTRFNGAVARLSVGAAMFLLAGAILVAFAPDAFAAVQPLKGHAGSFKDFLVQASPVLIALRGKVTDLEARASAKLAEITDKLGADDLRRIEAEHSELVTQLTSTRAQVVALETPAPVDEAAVRAAAVTAERDRQNGIRAQARTAGMTIEDPFVVNLIDSGRPLVDARNDLIEEWSRRQNDRPDNPPGGQVPSGIKVKADAVDRWAQGAERGLMIRAGLVKATDEDKGNEFIGLTMVELARSSLAVRNVKTGGLGRMEMVGRAFTVRNAAGMHSTSDFPNVLTSVAYKAMMKGYTEEDETFDKWTSKGTLTDFRPANRVDMGLFGSLDLIPEEGEYKYGTFGDTGATVVLATYGKLFAITRQAIINDDLQFFQKVPQKMGRAAKRTVGNLVYAILNGNPTMQDGVVLFHASHGNLAASGSVISTTSVGGARAAMARQKDDQGVGTGIGVQPKFLLVPPELRDLAQTIMTSERIPGDAAQIANPVRGAAEVISDSRLSGVSWFLAGDPEKFDTVEIDYLDGNDQPFLDQKEGWTVDGTEFKVRIDAGVKALHWRGLYKNPGA